jgi:cytochrome c-type biogenesis protein CcmH/NrfF
MQAKAIPRIWARVGLIAVLIAAGAAPRATSAQQATAGSPPQPANDAAQQTSVSGAQPPTATAPEQPTPRRGPTVRHPEAAEAISRVKSPYCPGLMLEVCPSGGGIALRDTIEGLAEDGWSADSIVNWLLANHGDTLLALPPAQGKGLVAWIVPPIAVVAGLSLVVVALRRMRREQPTVELGDDLTPDQKRELESAMKELEEEEEAPLF